MAHGFVVLDGPAANLNGPRRRSQGTIPRALRAGLVITEAVDLSAESLFDSSPNDRLPHIDGQRLNGVEVEVEPRPLWTIGAPVDYFPPTIRHVAEFVEFVGLTLGERHREFILELGEQSNLGNSA
jgi:hypothetical protein